MEAVRDSWTDERLDDLNHRVDEGFRRVDERFRRVDERFAQVDARFAQVDARFESLQRDFNMRFDAMQKLMIQLFGGMIGAFLTTTAALVATRL